MATDIEVYGEEFEALRIADSGRLQRYADYKAETEETRTIDLNADVGDLDYGRRVQGATGRRHRIPVPLGQATTVKHAYRISGRLPDAVVDRRAETPEERYRSDTMEKIWWGITRESQGDEQFASAAWDSSKVGAACFEAYWNIDKMMPLYRAIDPASVLVVRGVDDPHNFQRFYRFWTVPTVSVKSEYAEQTFRGAPVDVRSIQASTTVGNTDMTMIVERCDQNRRVRFALGQGATWAVGLYEQIHAYGFAPLVVIPNLGPARDVWGWADYEFVRALARYIPVLFGREADILKATANGAYIEKKTGQPLTVVEKVLAQGGILQSGRDGSLEPVPAPDVPSFAESHAQMALELFKMVGFAPDASWGDGAASSGANRGLQLQPQLELTGLKQQNWGPGLSRLGRMLFKMIEAKMPAGSSARYVGTVTKGHRNSPFNFLLGPGVQPDTAPAQGPTSTFDPSIDLPSEQSVEQITLPRNPEELFDKDYSIRFVWHNRINPDDPAFVTAELNKFAQGAQSLRTTLERMGVENPQDEMTLIEQEAERFPWLRNGLIQMIRDQLAQQNGGGGGQGNGGGNPNAGAPDAAAASAMTGTKDGAALDKHAMVAGLGSNGVSFNGQ